MRDAYAALPEGAYGSAGTFHRGRGGNRRQVEHELVERLPIYRRMAAQRLRSLVEAEEVAQAFALRALERADQLREPCALRGWLRRVFETTLIDHCRRSSGRRSREVPFETQLHDRAEESDPAAETLADPAGMVVALLPRLKPEYADVIRQVDLMERSRAEAAGDLGITVNNLTVRLHRARAALRSQLGAEPALMTACA
jgi:RNA polymerase sigma-70 factor (ECF subfamily)